MSKITVGDIDIHYLGFGSGQPLLMIMGLSFSLLDWGTQLLALLASHYQLILFDNREAGQNSQSQRNYTIQDTAELLEALNIPKAHIFGVIALRGLSRTYSREKESGNRSTHVILL
jgi:3-oxoadipate enol-lactonase